MKTNWEIPAQHDINRQKILVTQGPFKFSGKLIYLGLTLLFFGFSITLPSWFIFLGLLMFAYFQKAVEKEEELLEKHGGKDYLEYKSKVRRFS